MKPKRLFISGIPTAGKSWAGNLIATELDAIHVEIDDMRKEVSDPVYTKWMNFYYNQNERDYYKNTTREEQWRDLVKQSEGLWPFILKKIQSYENEPRAVVFEGVNILPHLAKRDIPDMPGIIMLGPSFEVTLDRNRQSPRWGHGEELLHIEAEAFFFGERPHYKEEGEKYGYEVCETATEAFGLVQKLWK